MCFRIFREGRGGGRGCLLHKASARSAPVCGRVGVTRGRGWGRAQGGDGSELSPGARALSGNGPILLGRPARSLPDPDR